MGLELQWLLLWIFPGGGRDRVSLKIHLDNRRDRQLQRGAGGSATTTAVVMNQIKVCISLVVCVLKSQNWKII